MFSPVNKFLFLFWSNSDQFCDVPCSTLDSVFIGQLRDSVQASIYHLKKVRMCSGKNSLESVAALPVKVCFV